MPFFSCPLLESCVGWRAAVPPPYPQNNTPQTTPTHTPARPRTPTLAHPRPRSLTPALTRAIGPGLELDLSLEVNTIGVAVNETFTFISEDGTTDSAILDLVAGPYFRAQALNAALTIESVTLSGNFAFESSQRVVTPGSPAVEALSIAAQGVTVVGVEGLDEMEGTGALLILTDGIAGKILGTG